jgi:hypothetical protein
VIFFSMKRVVRSSFISTFSLRARFLVYLTLAVSAFASAEIDRRGAGKATKVGLDLVGNSKRPALSPHQQRGSSKVTGQSALTQSCNGQSSLIRNRSMRRSVDHEETTTTRREAALPFPRAF